jgi:S1-C subfamily serine protease
MKRFLKYFLFLLALTLLSSCATQTNIINSLSKTKNSILKIETWASVGECNAELMTCPEDRILSTGTGAVVLHRNKKHVLTAAHVCIQETPMPGMKINFYFKAIDQENKQYIISVVNHDSKADICLLKSITGELEPSFIPLARRSPAYGEKVYNLAAPMGIIEKDMVPVFEGRFFGNSEGNSFFGMPAIGGSSGSPVVNFRGELVGMVHSVHYRFHHITLSATYQRLWNFLNVEKVRIIQVQN